VKKQRGKVLIAMSGGVDSSAAAFLLQREGYDVTGVFMVNYDSNKDSHDSNPQIIPNVPINRYPNSRNIHHPADSQSSVDSYHGSNCWRNEYRDAVRVAAKLDIPLLRFDFIKEYDALVMQYMYSEYEKGRTPNPDVLCNREIKFGVWMEKARELGFEYLATGHYARILCSTYHVTRNKKNTEKQLVHDTCYVLSVPKDTEKDQTYFLHQLNQDQLAHTLFPLGEYTKDEVREIARKAGLPTSEKEESMGICFVGEVSMKEFLQKKMKNNIGDVVMSSGEKIGEHDGLAFYTIGQRHFGIKEQGTKNKEQVNRPLFVVYKRMETNELMVGYEDDPLLWKKEVAVSDVHWVAGLPPQFPLQCEVRLRHRQKMQKCQMTRIGGLYADDANHADEMKLMFDEPQRAVTQGQFAVFYKDGVCLGGGVIV